MLQSQTPLKVLRLEAPFYLPDALARVNLGPTITMELFADDSVATAVNTALRASIEMATEKTPE